MRVLHTSDWHLGHRLYNNRRYDEFRLFTNHLITVIRDQKIDVLLVAGDIFDTGTPGTAAQQLYYDFLGRLIRETKCRHAVIIAGNHDSAAFLDAPRDLLGTLNIHVLGTAADVTESPEDEVLTLNEPDGTPGLIVCAVPFLHESDIYKLSEAPEKATDDRSDRLRAGIAAHFEAIYRVSDARRDDIAKQYGRTVPVVTVAHLYVTPGTEKSDPTDIKVTGEGVRNLYLGSALQMTADLFPSTHTDYVALGHIHKAYPVGGRTTVRYCGTPLPMGFNEADDRKGVLLVTWPSTSTTPTVETLPLPCFRPLIRARGSMDDLQRTLKAVPPADGESLAPWVEAVYTGDAPQADLADALRDCVPAGTGELIRVADERRVQQLMARTAENETLDELTPEDVFERCLDANNVPADERPGYKATFALARQALTDAASIHNQD